MSKIEIAKRLVQDRMSRSQLRNFYNESTNILQHITTQPNGFDQMRSRILKLRGFAHNATEKRSPNNAPQLFYEFISKNVELAAQSEVNFVKGFHEHFECVVLYFKGR